MEHKNESLVVMPYNIYLIHQDKYDHKLKLVSLFRKARDFFSIKVEMPFT